MIVWNGNIRKLFDTGNEVYPLDARSRKEEFQCCFVGEIQRRDLPAFCTLYVNKNFGLHLPLDFPCNYFTNSLFYVIISVKIYNSIHIPLFSLIECSIRLLLLPENKYICIYIL